MAKQRAKKSSRSAAKRGKPAVKKRPVKRAKPKAARRKAAPAKAAPAKKAVARRAVKTASPKKPAASPRRAAAGKSVIPPDRRPARGHHDMGGLPAGKVVPSEHDYALWEKRVDAMLVLLGDKKRGLMNTDMLRRGIESLPADAYERMSYYERWIHSVATMMLERGIVTREELEARIAKLRAAAAQ